MSRPEVPDAFTELKQFAIDPAAVRLLGREYCEQNLVVVLGRAGAAADEPVTVGMTEPTAVLVAEVETALGRRVRPVRLNAYEVRHALQEGFDGASAAADPLRLHLAPAPELSFDPERGPPEVLNQLLAQAVQRGASDVHIETYEDDVDVRFRIDGILHQIANPISVQTVPAVISRLKILAGLDIAERRVAQDGRVRAVYAGDGGQRRVDLRLSVVPGPCGEDAVLRLLDHSTPVIGLERLGLRPADLATLDGLIANPEGLVLVTGPTGSGKTTTLYSAIDRVRTPRLKLLTVEDPIEYYFDKINQKQVSEQMGFADYARAFMRQNPDVILIGEIRDEATAEAALRAAQTGHLVFSTLHTNDSVRTISRLETLGVDRGLIASTLLGALSQRLVRRLCPACREEAAPGEPLRWRLGLAPDAGPFYTARGCDACGGDGYRGRVGIFELFVPDEEAADMVAGGEPMFRIRARALERGMASLLEDALAKAQQGLTSLQELVRVVPYRMVVAHRGRDRERDPA